MHRTPRSADGFHFAGAWHALEFALHCMGHTLQIVRRCLVMAPQCHSKHWHIVNSFGFDDGRQGAQVMRQPVLIGIEHIVKPHQCFRPGNTDLELNRQHRHTRASYRIGVFNAGYLTQNLLGRARHHVLHIDTAGTRKRDQHIGHRHVDLRLFFPGCHRNSKQTQQQSHQRQQRRDGVELESFGQPPGNTQLSVFLHSHLTAHPPRQPPQHRANQR
ncbi:hypothetical protein GALL_425220 [mine drainage metagenome]|uniref:Uncharacterized protein n=1 Tax=mine drainage metagenome TaxID=410659 RepID=A0A1J5QII2_9ZZZZ